MKVTSIYILDVIKLLFESKSVMKIFDSRKLNLTKTRLRIYPYYETVTNIII